jgi:hypothetical protein
MQREAKVRMRTDMRYPERGALRRWTIPAGRVPPMWLAAGLAALGVWLAAGCSGQPAAAVRKPIASCSQFRLDSAQRLFLAARSNLVRYYKERGLATLNAAYGIAGDAILVARSTRNCDDFDERVRADALNLVRAGRQLRIVAYSTMRDPGAQTLATLLQEQYGEAFAGRDLD